MVSQDKGRELAERLVTRWHDAPNTFCSDTFTWRDSQRQVRPVRLWRRQEEILLAVAKHHRVSVRSGHKCGKTSCAAILAWWWLMTRRRARVILTAPSYTQVDEVLWAEVKRLYRSSRFPLGGKLGVKPDTGFETADGRQIFGFATDKPERAAGFSSPNILVIVDEASGFDPKIFEALQGNLAGGAHILLISNPTQTDGFFYDTHHRDNSGWHTIHMSSRECAEAWPVDLQSEESPGLATLGWCDDMLRDYGQDDPRYQVRVLGNFPTQGDDCVIQLALVDAAKRRWLETRAEGPLQLGVDTARFGTDYSSIVWSRGNWASAPILLKGCDNVEVAGRVRQVVREQRLFPDEHVEVLIDTSNNGGVADILRAGDDGHIAVRDMVASASASEGSDYSRLRDEVWGQLRAWLRGGGAIPDDRLLVADILAPKLGFDPRGKQKVESKLEMRRRLGRSTDRADALALAVYRDPSPLTYAQVFDDRYKGPSASW